MDAFPATAADTWIPEGLTAFCRFVSHLSGAFLVLTVHWRVGEDIAILASNADLPIQKIRPENLVERLDTSAAIVDLSASVSHLSSALLMLYPAEERNLYFLAVEAEEERYSGLLLLKSGPLETFQDALILDYLRSVLRQMLGDYWLLRERRYFQAKFHDLFDSLPIGILLIEGNGTVGHVNSTAEALLGIPAGQSSVATIARAFQKLRDRCINAAELQRLYAPLQQDLQFAIQCDWSTDEQVLYVDTHPILGNARQGRVWILQDVTAQRIREQSLQKTAERDALTGAYNRHFLERYRNDFEQKTSTSENSTAVMMIDIDHFKAINDQLGHAVGDDVLRAVSQRLQGQLRQRDAGVFIRWGGEEFVLLVPVRTPEEGSLVAERLRASIAHRPIRVAAEQTISVTISLGATFYRTGEGVTEDTIPRADTALYRAKQGGRNRCEWSQ
ncbi:sensor domain-containing diguanylate cyclase [Acidithiobacillus sp. CV18-2]|uniref:diguanylate cyclase n=1 Tax=Igneacidithiobacillus copahuensis TaxID=2724909 RepID=A0AAE2YQH5_9PROT|nr:sensor domain-containing diguanylate cyclase [Igneacidithiobacillus copahuensis]MBU2753570.1 sensor domain-containing diguanylate cyclase [Acidithiobacillus sp. CV18-3]MBU2757357.1 sensor domain-containing diguanylate cyclase [Acidithiobacillus sp. BN09-2]MBU2776064.1 sensor domain-containing diguanylate cyclase [Acidithiobacillus sp. CV18-2]MBU2795355.1 sensor domain-containing diguanylate cyclase [Acidithiobacillus sp. VAN18-2]MBU2800259.1 sensor domain-containing diguanylate cyclase [Aci